MPPWPPHGRYPQPPTCGRTVGGYLLVAAFTAVLWALPEPVAAVAGLVTAAGPVAASKRVLALCRCLGECGGFAVEVGGRLRIVVTRPAGDGA